MTDAAVLSEVLRRESRSYLQYVRESYPWAMGRDETKRESVLTIALEENAAMQEIARAMQKRHMPLPSLGGFPASFTTSNFIAVGFLVPKLIAAQKQGISALEASLASVQDVELKNRLHHFLEMKTKHLHDLEALGSTPQAA